MLKRIIAAITSAGVRFGIVAAQTRLAEDGVTRLAEDGTTRLTEGY